MAYSIGSRSDYIAHNVDCFLITVHATEIRVINYIGSPLHTQLYSKAVVWDNLVRDDEMRTGVY